MDCLNLSASIIGFLRKVEVARGKTLLAHILTIIAIKDKIAIYEGNHAFGADFHGQAANGFRERD
jgi:hypothetical protein